MVALLTCFYSAVAALALILSTPCCLCFSQQPLALRLRNALNPPLNLQLSIIYSASDSTNSTGRASMLTVVHLLSPFYAIFIAVSACVAAAFWFYTGILGDPDGRDKDDGRATVLGVRRWWEMWLERGLG